MNRPFFTIGRNAWVWALASALLLAAIPAFSQLPTGTISGVVKDPTGAVVPGAAVTIRNTQTGQSRTAISSGDGSYRFPALPVGTYDVSAESSGFKTETRQGLVLEVTQQAVVNFTLQVGAADEKVLVTGEAALVESTNSSVGGLVNERRISDLPLNGRNYIDLTLMQPGVAAWTGGGAGGSVGQWYSSNGAPTRSNNYMLDGSPINGFWGVSTASLAGTTLGVEGIKEYKVVTNTFSAEYGSSMGSQMTIVSKSGTNQFHGSAFEFLRNSALDARNFFDYATAANNYWRLPPFKRNNFGASLGGPIRKDKTFFFATYEGLRQRLGQTIVYNVLPAGCHGPAGALITNAACPQVPAASPATISPIAAPLLALYPNPNLPNNQYTFPFTQPTRVDYVQGRVDHTFSTADSVFVRYTLDDSNQLVQQSFGVFNNTWLSRNQYATVSETHIFSPSLLNTFRLSYTRTALSQTFQDSHVGPEYSMVPGLPLGGINVTGLQSFGPTTMNPVYKGQNLSSLSDDLFWTEGKHGLKFGFQINSYAAWTLDNFNLRGSLWFANIPAFLQAQPYQQTVLIPGGILDRYYQYRTVGLYIQDDYRLTSRLTLNLGLRWEFATQVRERNGRENTLLRPMDAELTPGPIIGPQSRRNYSPRIGFAWDVFGTGKTSIRGGFGIAYDIGGGAYGTLFTEEGIGDPPWSTQVITANPKFTMPLTIPPTGVDVKNPKLKLIPSLSLRVAEYNMKTPYNLQYNLFVAHQLPGEIALNLGYVGTRGIHLFQLSDGNSPYPAGFKDGVPYWTQGLPRPNPNYDSNYYMNNGADSWYNSLQVSVNRRLAKGIEAQSNYTWSKVMDTGQGWFSSDSGTGNTQPTYRFDARRFDKGPSGFDLTHNLRFNVLYHFPKIAGNNVAAKFLQGWWMGNNIAIQTGWPLTPTVSADRALAGNKNEGGANLVRPNLSSTFNRDKLITGDPNRWFDPTMFSLQAVGFLGNAARGIIRSPGLRSWDFSLNKDTRVPGLGENGALQFRAEIFNIINFANFGSPITTVFAGALANATEAPQSTAGRIASTRTTGRQMQFALKLIF